MHFLLCHMSSKLHIWSFSVCDFSFSHVISAVHRLFTRSVVNKMFQQVGSVADNNFGFFSTHLFQGERHLRGWERHVYSTGQLGFKEWKSKHVEWLKTERLCVDSKKTKEETQGEDQSSTITGHWIIILPQASGTVWSAKGAAYS